MLKTTEFIKISCEVAVQKTALRILRGRVRQVRCEKQRERVYIYNERPNRLSELRSDARKVFARPTAAL